ncbi:MAG: vWA domain-containing protein [Hyphomicrobiaceae bacterium]
MTERDLKSLKDLPIPAPGARAKAYAVRAAVDAFDAAGMDTPEAEESLHNTKGDGTGQRPTHMIKPKPRSFMMRLQSSHYAIAASLAAAFIAVPAGLYFISQERHSNEPGGMMDMFSGGARAPAPSADEAVRARLAQERSLKREQQQRSAVANKPQRGDDAFADLKAAAEADRKFVAKPAAQPGTLPPPATATIAAAPPPVGGQMSLELTASADRARSLPRLESNRDRFDHFAENPVKQVATDPVSTFSIDVDTASYGFVRKSLNAGRLPPADAVRVEEMINYFNYDYAPPEAAEVPFRPTVTVLPSLWNPDHQLVHVAIQGYELQSAERPTANLVFLIDVSGSMGSPDKLPLVKNSLKMLLDNLRPDDTVGLVTYASGSGIALEPTKVADKAKILSAIDALGAGGSTAGAAGIEDAYRLAESNFNRAAVNRVILATDGDFNVGLSDQNQLKSMIERKRQSGVFLSIIGVGQGNYNDALMQTLAQNGNGTAAYIDTLNEARKVLVEEASSTLFPIAKDVKIQVEFNPAEVSEYRLVGYETRALRREDFNNDKVDAGDVGSGHAVTAVYDITPVGKKKLVDDLRYGQPQADAAKSEPVANAKPGELGFLKLRYKLPREDKSRLIEVPIRSADAVKSIDAASKDVRFAMAVATFGQMLKGGNFTGTVSYDDVIALATKAKGDDPFGLRAEFVNLVRLAKSVK